MHRRQIDVNIQHRVVSAVRFTENRVAKSSIIAVDTDPPCIAAVAAPTDQQVRLNHYQHTQHQYASTRCIQQSPPYCGRKIQMSRKFWLHTNRPGQDEEVALVTSADSQLLV